MARFGRRALVGVGVGILSGCAPRGRVTPHPMFGAGAPVASGQPPVPGAPTGVTAFVDVGVVPMDSDRVLTRQTVLIDGGRIRALGPVSEVAVPAGARRIDGRGKFLIPGLADMHVHFGMHFGSFRKEDSAATEQTVARELFLFLANGVTTVRHVDYSTTSNTAPIPMLPILNATVRRLRAQAAAGTRWSPLIYTSARWRLLGDSQSIEHNLIAYKAAGYDFVKLHGEGGALLDSIAAAARQVGIPIMGHVGSTASNDSVRVAIALGYTSVEHLTGYPGGGIHDTSVTADTMKLPELVALTRQAGLWNCPTQIVYELTDSNPARWPEARYNTLGFVLNPFWASDTATRPNATPRKVTWIKLRRRLIKMLQDAGAGLLVGSDNPLTVPGFGTQRELQALVGAGLTPYQGLVAGTRNPAVFFGALNERGTVAVGKRADLVLLRSNPLEDIRYAAHPAGVMIGGRWLSRRAIDRQLSRYTVHAKPCDPFHSGCLMDGLSAGAGR